jgi:hypothetical protein
MPVAMRMLLGVLGGLRCLAGAGWLCMGEVEETRSQNEQQ